MSVHLKLLTRLLIDLTLVFTLQVVKTFNFGFVSVKLVKFKLNISFLRTDARYTGIILNIDLIKTYNF